MASSACRRSVLHTRHAGCARFGHYALVTDELQCVRCGRPVVRNQDSYVALERMHWVCFHYEFEHFDGTGDPDPACSDPSCPARAFDRDPPPVWRATEQHQSADLAPRRSVPPASLAA
jgi:ferredoxin